MRSPGDHEGCAAAHLAGPLLILVALSWGPTSARAEGTTGSEFQNDGRDRELQRSSLESAQGAALNSAAEIRQSEEPLGEALKKAPFLFSPIGAGRGRSVAGLGVRALAIIPMLEVNYVRGLTERLDLVTNLASLGLLTVGDFGLRYCLAGGPETSASLAVKAAATPVLAAFSSPYWGLAATPGLVFGVGDRDLQFSFGMDAPLFLGAGEWPKTAEDHPTQGAEAETVRLFFRPNVALEFRAGESMNLYLQSQLYVSEGLPVLPFFAFGASW